MSAVKIVFKRSSLLGKRPTGANLEPGEIGLNTNSNDPGLFFEVSDGSVVKAGPTSYLPEAPTQIPARGELWVDSDTKALSIGGEDGDWQRVAAPFLGGTNGITVFVAPDYPNATDSLANDGQTVPFITINRAILEVTKKIIADIQAGLAIGNNRYLIVLAPGQHCVVNRPGVSANAFDLDLSDPTHEVTQEDFSLFNPADVGGLILPRGVSIIGMDLKKCEIHPTYVPKYTHPAFPVPYTQEVEGLIYENQTPSSIFRWSGNTYVSNFTGLDKKDYRLATQVTEQEGTGWAIINTENCHGLDFNDFVQITYSDSTDQVGARFTSGAYYVNPIDSRSFLISPGYWEGSNENPVTAADMPTSYFTSEVGVSPKFGVWNIYPYYVPADGESYELSSYSHHRLSVLKNASLDQLNAFYTKVQKAFPVAFGGQVDPLLASAPEYQIVAPTAENYPNNLPTNSTDNTSPYQNMVNHRSDFGMANGDYDGDLVSGFKSVIINASTAVILQKDPVAYEVYSSSDQNWVQLTRYTQQTSGSPSVTSVPLESQRQNLNDASIPNIRYYYKNATVTDPDSNEQKSIGVPDPDHDFRHFGFRLSGANSYMQAQSTYSIGAAIAVWAKRGAIVSLTNATTNFGSVAMQTEGFAGLGTLGGANEVNKGYLLSGIVRPLQLLEESVVSDEQKRVLFLGSRVMAVALDPEDPSVQLLYLQRPFDAATILPFSLKPGSAVYTTDGSCSFRAFFVTDGSPTCILSGTSTENPYSEGGAVLRVRASDSTIPSGESTNLDIPYIRRYVDPRTSQEKSYGFFVQSTNPLSQSPQVGQVIRLNQTGQNLSDSLKRNFQFDPGIYGGISQTFTVDYVETNQYSSSPNFNYKVSDSSQDTNYVVYSALSDASTPWVQSVPTDPDDLNSELVPFYNPQGSYITYQNKNYYAAENNLWTSLYYKTNFNALNGPTKVSPEKTDSPFVVTSVLEKTELVSEAWQGLVPDPYFTFYTEGVPEPYRSSLSYLRGATIPNTKYSTQFQVDADDSTDDFGIIYKRTPVDSTQTVIVADTITTQTPRGISSPFASSIERPRPEVMQMEMLAVQQITQPKEGLSILELTNNDVGAREFVRVIGQVSNTLQVIRNYYPEYAIGDLPDQWPSGTVVKSCVSSGFPEPSVYDPDWTPTKATMFRFFQLMGYKKTDIDSYLTPRYSGERNLNINSIPLSPIGGYANLTTSWPIEFNNPSQVIANTHTWQYAGYFDYSRGLPKYQVNEISKKLSYDFLSTTTWGGKLTVTGANELGQLVFLGDMKEALTGQYFETETPLSRASNRQVYQSPEEVTFPNPVLVFSVDDISDSFKGVETLFPLTRNGYPVPASQLSEKGLFVFLGGVVQTPGVAYTLVGTEGGAASSKILFSEAPAEGTSCDIRVVTTDDLEESLEIQTFGLASEFDGSNTSFDTVPTVPTLSNSNSFIFLGGVEQNPFGTAQTSAAYFVDDLSDSQTINFIGEAPEDGSTFNGRAVLSGQKYRASGIPSVFITSLDDIAPLFNGTLRSFPLEIGGDPIDPQKVNAENMFVSLGGVMQLPIPQKGDELAGLAYTVGLNPVTKIPEITFAVAPSLGATCNVRVITSEEFLTCPLPDSLVNTSLQFGPGIKVNADNQIIEIDPDLIG